MQPIFKYDFDRLTAYAHTAPDQIKTASEETYMMMAFQDVNYFNYTFTLTGQPLTHTNCRLIEDFYYSMQIPKHRIIVSANCKYSNAVFGSNSCYTHTKTIVKTVFDATPANLPATKKEVAFVRVDAALMPVFTQLFLQGFDAHNRNTGEVVCNFINMLEVAGMSLFLVKYKNDYVGINVLYETEAESLLAEGTTVPEYRNRGFHKSSLAFRIQLALQNRQDASIAAWAYKDSVSLHNMYKLQMKTQQEFNVYEYCR